MKHKIHIETDRLILRDITHDDTAGLFELDSSAEVHQYLGANPVQHIDQIPAVIDFIRNQYKTNGIGRWAVLEKKTGEFMGWCGLKYITEKIQDQQHFYELGYRFIPRYWGNGFATEAGTACVAYGFDTLGVKEIFAMTECGNIGSDSVLRKIGFQRMNSFDMDNVAHFWYKAAQTYSNSL